MRKELFYELADIKENAAKSEFNKKNLQILKSYAEAAGDDISDLPFSDFLKVYTVGSRKEYEYKYFEHRRRLNAFAILAAVYPENEEYLKKLEDTVWAVLNEFTWAVPAHTDKNADISKCRKNIDLFAAETAFALSEISIMHGDRFDEMLLRRIEYEIRQRTVESFLENKCGWEEWTNNWSAVCAGSVGSVFLYMAAAEEIKAAMPRIRAALNAYLSGFGSDGACCEGINYWIYGFGYFSYFAELLYRYTDGNENLFDSEKVRNIALFQQKILFANNKTVSFSDCGGSFFHRAGLSALLKKRIAGFKIPPIESAADIERDNCFRFAHAIRDVVWGGEEEEENSFGDEVFYFEDAGWYIKRAGELEFAIKAGNNAESHNHNDIGSFIFNAGGETVITDPGKGEYTADYFGEKRYGYFAPSGFAHSIPVIGGKTQPGGEQYFGKIISAGDNGVSVDIKNAYDVPLKSFIREAEFNGCGFTLTDTVCFEKEIQSISEHFVSELKPVKEKDGVRIGACRLFTEGGEEAEIKEVTFSNGYDRKKTVYTIDIRIRDVKSENVIKTVVGFRMKD